MKVVILSAPDTDNLYPLLIPLRDRVEPEAMLRTEGLCQ